MTAALCVLALLGAVYCLGGLHGLWLAWTQEARMSRWAAKASKLHTALVEAEERGRLSGRGPAGVPGEPVPAPEAVKPW